MFPKKFLNFYCSTHIDKKITLSFGNYELSTKHSKNFFYHSSEKFQEFPIQHITPSSPIRITRTSSRDCEGFQIDKCNDPTLNP